MKGIKSFSINKKDNSWLKFLIGGVVLLFLLLVLNCFGPSIQNCFYAISSPIQKTFWIAGESSSFFLSSLFNGSSLSRENERLVQENEKLLSQVAILQSIKQSNWAQSEVSTTCQNSGLEYIMAGVVGLEDDDILSINKGSDDGVIEGMPVMDQHSVLFGKILKVYKNFSKVMLISNKNSVVNVKIQQQSQEGEMINEVDGVVRGNGELSAYLDLIPISSEINTQDILLTSSIEKSFPKDLLVGKILQSKKNDQDPFQQAEISLFFDIKDADNLFVITNYKQAN